jgi:hypothetical protein
MTDKQEKKEHDLIDLFEKKLDFSSDFPFLIDKQTVEFVRNSQVSNHIYVSMFNE